MKNRLFKILITQNFNTSKYKIDNDNLINITDKFYKLIHEEIEELNNEKI